MPKISVILTSCNHEHFVGEAIQSVLDQTFDDFELIIFDDCSDDGSVAVIERFDDPRIRFFQNPERLRGRYGIEKSITTLARGEYIAIHHSDDVWLPEKLEKQLAVMESGDYGAVFTRVQVILEDGSPLDDPEHFYHHVFDVENRSRYEWLRLFFTGHNCLCHPSILIRRECYEKIGLYDQRLAQIPDFDMWVRLCLHYEIHVMEEPLIQFRILRGKANASADRDDAVIRSALEWGVIFSRFLSIKDDQLLHRIFPDLGDLAVKSGNVIPFVVARYALENTSGAMGAPAYTALFNLFGNPEMLSTIERIHGFTNLDFVQLTGRYDCFGHLLAKGLNEQTKELRNETVKLKDQLDWVKRTPLIRTLFKLGIRLRRK